MRNNPKVLTAYPPARLERIMKVLVRASGGRNLDRTTVEQSLLEVIHGVELAMDGREDARLWHELSLEEPSPKRERDGFLRLATAQDPFALLRRSRPLSALLRRSLALQRVNGRWRRAGFTLSMFRGAKWDSLSAVEQAEFRMAMEDAAESSQRYVRQARPTKAKFDAAMLCLADLFLSWTGQRIASHRVPYSVNSQFIQFAVAALEPVGRYFEVSHPALARRWERIVRAARKEAHELEKALAEPESDCDR